MSGASRKIGRFGVVFDEGSLAADAGLVAAATLLDRLGAVDRSGRLGGRPGGASPGRKILTLVSSMTVGGTHIDHVDRLRAGATGAVLGFGPAAPSTVGTLLAGRRAPGTSADQSSDAPLTAPCPHLDAA